MQNIKGLSKLLLSAFLMKKINSRIVSGSGGIVSKYIKLMLVGYLFKKLKTTNISLPKFEKEAEPVEEPKPEEKHTGSSALKIAEIIMGVAVGAVIIYAVRKYAAKSSRHEIPIE